MSAESRVAPTRAPQVLARLAGSTGGPAGVERAIAAGAALVEIPLEVLAASGAPVGAGCVVPVHDLAGARRAVALGAAGLRVEPVGSDRDALVGLAVEHGLLAHVPIGRGVPEAAFVDVGDLDAGNGDDLVGRLAALADLAAAGRSVIASIAAVGPDDTATLAALATERGAAVLRVVEVAAAARAAAVLAAIGGRASGRSR
ncbi:MAG: hypothetical protein ACKO72_04555 [Actinomycetes bacterium]